MKTSFFIPLMFIYVVSCTSPRNSNIESISVNEDEVIEIKENDPKRIADYSTMLEDQHRVNFKVRKINF